MRLTFSSTSAASLLLVAGVRGCAQHVQTASDIASSIGQNNQARSLAYHRCLPKVAIDNVRVFDGQAIGPPSTVVIDGDVIGYDATGATDRIDGEGGVLLPGFIDSHSHPGSIQDLHDLTSNGVTTAFQLACFSKQQCSSLQGHRGLVDMHLGASTPAAAPGSIHGSMIMNITANSSLLVHGNDDVGRWVEEQMLSAPGFFKLVAQSPGLSQDTLNTLVRKAHGIGKRAVCHAADAASHRQAAFSGVDMIHHLPLDAIPDEETISQALVHDQTLVPTLSVMKAFSDMGQGNYSVARESLQKYHDAGLPIIAGTDANNAIAAAVPFGQSLHLELELMVDAGLSTVEVLRSATSLAAERWGLCDRGVIAPGKRADLVLVNGDPLLDIGSTRNIRRVWVAGEEYDRDRGSYGPEIYAM